MINVIEKATMQYLSQKKQSRNEELRARLARPCTQEDMFSCLARIENLFAEKKSKGSLAR